MKSAFCTPLLLGCSWLGSAYAAEPDPIRSVAPEPSSEPSSTASGAAPSAPPPLAPTSSTTLPRWRLRLVVPLWLPFLSAQSTATNLDFEADNVTLDSQVSWIVTGVLEAGYSPLFARVDVFGVGFSDQVVHVNGEGTRLAFDSSGLVGRAVLMYELGPWKLGQHSRRWEFTVAPLAGARYNRIALETGEPTNSSGHYQWVDPLVGARTEITLGDFRLGTQVDFGGFGLSSDIAFWASASLEYLATDWFSLWLGWQHYQVLFDETTSDGEHRLRLYLTGPSAGISLNLF